MAPKGQHHQLANLTDPEHLKAHGLKIKGDHIVTDDGDEEVIRPLTDNEKRGLGRPFETGH